MCSFFFFLTIGSRLIWFTKLNLLDFDFCFLGISLLMIVTTIFCYLVLFKQGISCKHRRKFCQPRQFRLCPSGESDLLFYRACSRKWNHI